LLGSTVGPYQILEKLGVGGMGEVFLGHDPRLQRRVALKCLAAPPAGAVGDRILREARAAARLNHPNIAGVYDVIEQDDRTFIVMEYIEGESLAARLRRGLPSVEEVRAFGRQLASALAAAHAQGVVHRDLKPANVMFARDGTIKVLDFGVAKLSAPVAGTEDATGHVPPESTLQGNPGTPVYMSPEQLFDRPIDGRSDLYSAGVILFEMVTGRRPYSATGAVSLALAMSRAPAPSPRSIVPSTPGDLDAVIVRALERDPAHRFQTARDMEVALSTTEPVTALTPLAALTRSAHFARWAMTGALALVTLAMVVLGERTLWESPSTPAPPAHAVLAVLPVDNPGGDPGAEFLGGGIAAVIAGNLGSISGLTVLSRTSTAPYAARRSDLAAMHREIGADFVLDLTMKSAGPRADLIARLKKADSVAPIWEATIGGDALAVERSLLDQLGRLLERSVLLRRLTPVEQSRLRTVPTSSGDALLAYSQARAFIGPSNSPETTDRAIAMLQDAIAKDPSFALAYALLGDAYWQKYQRAKTPDLIAKATAAVTEALRLDPDQAQVHYSLGNMYQQTGRYEEAIAALRRAIQIQPDDDESHALLARVLAAKGDYKAASDEAKRAVDVRPGWSSYFNQGRVEIAAGHLDRALVALRRATELNPGFAGGFQMLGATYQMMGDWDNAIGNYEHSIRLEPNAPAYSNLGLAYLRAKRYPEAIDAYSEAIKSDPQQPSRYRNLADAFKAAGRQNEARENYSRALALAQQALVVNSRDAVTIALVALCEANLGRRAEASRHAAEAATVGAASGDVRFRLTKVYLALDERSAALATLKAAVAAGYDPKAAREDDELAPLRGADFETAVAAGLAARKAAAGR